MKRLGATIEHHHKPLSDDEIDYLSPEDAHEVNMATRLAYGAEGLRKLFEEQLRISDRMWKDLNATSAGLPAQAARADQLQKAVVQANPDHFFLYLEGGRADTRGCTPDSAAHVKPGHAASAAVRGRPWKADGYTHRATGTDAVRYTSVDTAI
jgi:hypothetical protein